MKIKRTQVKQAHVTVLAWVLGFFVVLTVGLMTGGAFAFIAGMFGFLMVKKAVDSYFEEF